jgi:O-antigen/teichoic acid export membrane protein
VFALPAVTHVKGYHLVPQDDQDYAQRQLDGLVALLAIAEPDVTVLPFAGTAVRMRYSGSLEKLDQAEPDDQALQPSPARTGQISSVLRLMRSNQLLRSSLNIILNAGVQSAFGFAFWILAARLFSTANVGRASSLISASTLLAFFGLLGLNITFLRFLPVSQQRDRLITAGLILVGGFSGVLGLGYVFLTPVIARPISFVAHNPLLALGFVVLTIGGGLSSITDSIFISAGKASFNIITDGLVGGIVKIALVVGLAGGGTYEIFFASSSGFAAAGFSSILLMMIVLRWRPKFGDFKVVLRPVLRFTGVNYVAGVLSLLPTLIVPLIVLNRLGATNEAYYYVSYQLANLIYTAAFSVEQAFLVEGASAGVITRAVLMRSLRVLLGLCIPAFIVVLLFGHEMLMAFGAAYGEHATAVLIPLTTAVLPIALNNWSLTILRLSNKLQAVVWSNVVYVVVITGLAWILAGHGLGVVSLSWPIGTSASALVAGTAAYRTIRRQRSAPDKRHRRGRQEATAAQQ